MLCAAALCCPSAGKNRGILDCESCTWPISAIPASTNPGDLGLLYNGFVLLHVVSSWPRSSCCSGVGGLLCALDFGCGRMCFPSNAHSLHCFLMYHSTITWGARGKVVFCLRTEKKPLLITGCVEAHTYTYTYTIQHVCPFVSSISCMCAHRGISGYQSCTLQISTSPGLSAADEPKISRGICFVAHRLEIAAITALLRLRRPGFVHFGYDRSSFCFVSSNSRHLLYVRGTLLPPLPLN